MASSCTFWNTIGRIETLCDVWQCRVRIRMLFAQEVDGESRTRRICQLADGDNDSVGSSPTAMISKVDLSEHLARRMKEKKFWAYNLTRLTSTERWTR